MFKKLSSIFLSFSSLFILSACNDVNLEQYFIEDLEVIFNNEEHSLIYNDKLDDVEVEYYNNTHKDVGVYEVKAIFSSNNDSLSSTATLTINPYLYSVNDLNLKLTSLYTGEIQSIEYDDLFGVDISFLNENEYLEVGVYNNTIIMTSNNSNFGNVSFDIEFKIVENEEYFLNSIILNNKEVEFNYEAHELLLDEHDVLIEKGFEINYFYQNAEGLPVNAGVYDVVVEIQKDNLFRKLNSSLVINRKNITPSIIGDNLIELGQEFNFNVDVDINDPIINKVFYDKHGNVINRPHLAGTYYLSLDFQNETKNYNIENVYKEFTISLSHRDLDLLNDIVFNNKEVEYNGESHLVRINNHNILIDHGFEIEYINDNQVHSGEYIVRAVVSKNGYQREYTALLIINKTIIIPSVEEIYIKEGEFYSFEINNLPDDVFSIFNYYDLDGNQIGKPSSFGEYTLKVVFYVEHNNYILDELVYNFQIHLSDYEQFLIDRSFLEDKEVAFNNEYQTLSVANASELRDNRFIVRYMYNENVILPKEVGVYEVRATIEKNGFIIKQMVAVLTIY